MQRQPRAGARAAIVLAVIGLAAAGCGGDDAPKADGQESSRPPSSTTTSPSKSTTRAAEGKQVRNGEVTKVDKMDGVQLKSPQDGKLRNFGIDAAVLEFGTADAVESGSSSSTRYVPEPGGSLLAFKIKARKAGKDDISGKVTASVAVDGIQRSLPGFDSALSSYTSTDSATLSYIVGVPQDRRSVELELKYVGLAQKFDLLEGVRKGDQPTVLYRSESGPTIKVESLTPSQVTVAPNSKMSAGPGALVFGEPSAELSYFAPTTGNVPADKEKAWLVLRFKPAEGAYWAKSCVVPPSAFSATDETGAQYPAHVSYSKAERYSEHVIVFEVPATVKKPVVSAAPRTVGCSYYSGNEEQWAVTGPPARIEVPLPER
ncbi:hypothetical protein [Herbihabitans rhizosphaerae]|nr:hypothetical protein [Herbihabitans rhizosphaerae]